MAESEEGHQPAKSRWEKVQAKNEKRALSDFKYQMQTGNQERVAFVDMEFMEMSGFCRDGIRGKRRTIRDGVFNEQTWKLEDQSIMSGSTLEYMRENWGEIEAEYSFDTIVKLAEWHVKGKYPRMVARLPRELAWSFRAVDGAKIHFGHYEVQPLVPLTVFFGMDLDLINRRDRGAWVRSEKHLHQLAYYQSTPYWDTVVTAVKKMAKAMAALKVAKIVVNGTEPDARLL